MKKPSNVKRPAGSAAATCSAHLLAFNINDHVLVRLTKEGMAAHRKQYDELNTSYGGRLPWKYEPPKTDANGWSRWQLHDLMRQFGAAIPITVGPVPFETVIKLEVGQNVEVSHERGG